MSNKQAVILASALFTILMGLPASAQGNTFDLTSVVAAANTNGSAGSEGNTSARTQTATLGTNNATFRTGKQRVINTMGYLPVVSTCGFTRVYGIVGYGSIGGGSFASGADYADAPNYSDTYADLAARNRIMASEERADAQSDANAEDSAAIDNSQGGRGGGRSAGF